MDLLYTNTFKLAPWLPTNLISPLDLSLNPNAVDFLIENPQYIDWDAICMNKNPKVLQILMIRP